MTLLTPDELVQAPLFASLDQDQLRQILDRHRETQHAVDQILVMEQDWGESVFLMLSGLAKVRTYTADGEEVVMSLLGAGDVFGEMVAGWIGSICRRGHVDPCSVGEATDPTVFDTAASACIVRLALATLETPGCGISTTLLPDSRRRCDCSMPWLTWPEKVRRTMIH